MSTDLPDTLDDRAGRRQVMRAPCARCVHASWSVASNDLALSCPGFPNGIPDAIQRGENDHRNAVEGDGGYRFTPR